jgi:hypothetical protein
MNYSLVRAVSTLCGVLRLGTPLNVARKAPPSLAAATSCAAGTQVAGLRCALQRPLYGVLI